jgi:hypothetical protein
VGRRCCPGWEAFHRTPSFVDRRPGPCTRVGGTFYLTKWAPDLIVSLAAALSQVRWHRHA